MTTAADRWRALFSERYAWAFRTYDDFMSSLSPEIRERMGHKSADEEAYVVVFGSTQVGKTTLIIDLMGVQPEAMKRVSTVLRGGRVSGRSATSTAMEYRRSPDERWGLRIEDSTRWMDTDEEMTHAIGELRASMEAQRLEVPRPCLVCIPSDCFGTAPSQTLVRILDLPGDQPANVVELEHVYDMARRYIPLADLILLVGRSDDLTFLQPGRLTLPGIENWQSVPSRFRVVTTFSFSPQDVRDSMRRTSGSPDVREIRESLIAEIERAGPLAPGARRPEWFFPLEFGNSWLNARVKQSDLYERVSPLIEELKHQLRQEIRESTGTWARLKNAVSAHAVVANLMDERLAQMRHEEALIERDVQEFTQNLTLAWNDLGNAKRHLKSAEERIKMLSPERLNEDVAHLAWPPLDQLVPSDKSDTAHSDKTVSRFRMWVEEVRAVLVRTVSEVRPLKGVSFDKESTEKKRQEFWLRLTIGHRTAEVNQIVEAAFQPLVAQLNRYTLDRYFWFTNSDDSDYQTDMRRFKACLATASRNVQMATARWWCEAANAGRDLVVKNANSARAVLKGRYDCVERMQTCLQGSSQRLEKAVENRMLFEHRMQLELGESRRFTRMLDERYLKELQMRRRSILKPQDPCGRLLALMAAVQMAEAQKKLRHDVSYGIQDRTANNPTVTSSQT